MDEGPVSALCCIEHPLKHTLFQYTHFWRSFHPSDEAAFRFRVCVCVCMPQPAFLSARICIVWCKLLALYLSLERSLGYVRLFLFSSSRLHLLRLDALTKPSSSPSVV